MKKLIAVAVLGAFVALSARAVAADKSKKGKLAAACKKAKECKGPLPDICERCADGRERCAHWTCVADKCQVEICPPTVAHGDCKAASDCKGPLPELCEVCADGKDGCAHWACVANKCEIQYCAPQCTAAADCKGILPDLCMECPKGGMQCAHWACVGGKCETQICP